MTSCGDHGKAEHSWSSVSELLEKLTRRVRREHPHEITTLALELEGDTIVVTGIVGSERARSAVGLELFGFDGVMKVRNRLEVAGFFEPASDEEEDAYFAEKKVASDFLGTNLSATSEGGDGLPSEVIRYPRLKQDVPAAAGISVRLEINLAEISTGSEPFVSLGAMAPGWNELAIEVQVSSPWLPITPTNPQIILREDGSSIPAVFHAEVPLDFKAAEGIAVTAYFLHGTRICGHADWPLEIEADSEEAETRTTPSPEIPPTPTRASAPATEGQPRITIAPEAAGPSLMVMIGREATGNLNWMWTAALPGETSTGSQVITVDGAAFASSLLSACPTLSASTFRRRMKGIGEQIWGAAPANFRAAYLSYRERLGTDFPIQFLSDDPFIPWELMVADDSDHLFLDHPVSRWPLSKSSAMAQRLPRGTILSFVPNYPGNGSLPAAIEEGEWIVRERAALAVEPKRDRFLDVLDGNHSAPVAVIHFAGHGRADSGKRDAGIRFEDDWVTLDDVTGSSVKLGRSCRTFVVLNACEAGSQSAVLGMNWGWPDALTALEFAGVLAPLWKVEDSTAGEILKHFLPALHDRTETLGRSLRDARRSHANSSVSALAYIAHGDVMAICG